MIISGVLITIIFTVVILGPGILAALIQWMLRNTRAPRSDTIIAFLYAIIDVTIRKANTAEYVEKLSSALSNHVVEHKSLAMGFFFFLVVFYYLIMIKLGKAIIKGVKALYSFFKNKVKCCQHVPPVQPSAH